MKKQYMTPAIVIAMANTTNICAVSLGTDNNPGDNIVGDTKASSMWDWTDFDDEDKEK